MISKKILKMDKVLKNNFGLSTKVTSQITKWEIRQLSTCSGLSILSQVS